MSAFTAVPTVCNPPISVAKRHGDRETVHLYGRVDAEKGSQGVGDLSGVSNAVAIDVVFEGLGKYRYRSRNSTLLNIFHYLSAGALEDIFLLQVAIRVLQIQLVR
jgi:hypothetical protein